MNHNQHSLQTDVFNPIVLRGQTGYTVAGDRVIVQVDEIANDRHDQNLSGTLALELWALAQPYQGGGFTGHSLAATQLGEVQGQHCLRGVDYNLAFQQPPAGTWHLVLMLREWQDGAFITRDFVNFPQPYSAMNEQPATRHDSLQHDGDNVIEVNFRDAAREPQPAVKADIDTAQPAAKVKKAAAKTKKTKAEPARLSVNRASLAELTAVKGISEKLAQAIVASRPVKSLDDLLNVKGMGKKLLEKIEHKISL